MGVRILRKTWILFLIVLNAACSKDDNVPLVIPEVTLVEKEGKWLCEFEQTCENIYQFEFKKDSKISVSVENVTGNSTASLDLSVDFGQFGGPNLLNNGAVSYYGCTDQDEEISLTNITISETAIYNFSVARDWGLSVGPEGSYKMTVISDTPFIDKSGIIQNSEAISYERECL